MSAPNSATRIESRQPYFTGHVIDHKAPKPLSQRTKILLFFVSVVYCFAWGVQLELGITKLLGYDTSDLQAVNLPAWTTVYITTLITMVLTLDDLETLRTYIPSPFSNPAVNISLYLTTVIAWLAGLHTASQIVILVTFAVPPVLVFGDAGFRHWLYTGLFSSKTDEKSDDKAALVALDDDFNCMSGM
ncbi:MAG: hypothetical protein Q9169_006620 [Polycauliona sp. 2 TL-2023]